MINIKTHIISEAFEQLSKSEKLNESVKSDLLKLFKSKGFDLTREDVHNYIDSAAEYIEMAQDADGSYSVEEWYKDTLQNYPEDLEELQESKLVENDKFDVRKLTPKDIEEMRRAIRRPKGLSLQQIQHLQQTIREYNKLYDESKLTEKLDKKEIDLKLLNKDPAIFVSPEDAFELSQYLDSKNILYSTRNVLTPVPEKNYEKIPQRAFDIDYSSPRSIATPNEMVTLRHSDCSILGSISAQTSAFDFPYISPASNKLPRISRSDYYKLKSLFKDLNKIWKKPEYQDKQNEIVDKISDIVSEIQGINESLIKDNQKREKKMKIVAEDFQECNLNKMGTNEYEANKNRDKHVEMYRKFANLNESEEITEDNINDWALQKTATYCNRHPDRIKAEILGKRYSEYERD